MEQPCLGNSVPFDAAHHAEEQSHLKKAGTPTMGGVIFLLSTVITSLFYIKDYPKIIPVLF